jgi:hypothetical protein
MVAKMDNLSVAISNMAISFKVLGNEIFQSGVGRFFKDLTAQATSAVNAMAVAVAAMRGSGLGITLEAPQINSEMNFEQMQSERARAAHANIKKITDEMKRLADTSKDSSLKKFFDNFDYKNLIYGSAGAIVEFGNAMLAAGVDSEDAQKIIKELNLEIMVQAKALGQATKILSLILMEGENALESFKNFAKNMVSQIIATFLQMAVVNEILNNVFGKDWN